MNERRIELAVRRRQLQAQCAIDREHFVQHVAGLTPVFSAVDTARHGIDWLKQRPQLVAAATAGLLVVRPSLIWRWGKRAFFAVRFWRKWQSALMQRLG